MDAFSALLAALLAWLTAVGERYPWLGPLSAIVGIVTAAVGMVLWLRRKIVGRAYRIRREVEEKNERLEADVAALRSQVVVLNERLPEAAWERVGRERLDGNEESAIRGLHRYMDTEGARLSEMARQIAHFHLGLVTERDRDRHLVPAERFALLAFHLDPRNGEGGHLLREVQQLRGDPFEHVQFTDDVSMPEDDPGGYYGLPQTPDAVISLLRDADKAVTRGHYRHALALADSALLSAQRAAGKRHSVVLGARYVRATALKFLGRSGEALAEIDGSPERPSILWLHEQDRGSTQSSTLNARWQRADVLKRLGRYDEALAEIDGTLERPGILSLDAQSPDFGPAHPHTLTTRWLRADVLQSLGRYNEALAEIDGGEEREGILFLREQNPDLGRMHPDTLTARCLRAGILKSLGRYDEALVEIDGGEARPGILSLQEQSSYLGPTHPLTLVTRYERAEVLRLLKRYDEALAEVDGTDDQPGVLPVQEQSPDVGPMHPQTLVTRQLRGVILRDLGRIEEQ